MEVQCAIATCLEYLDLKEDAPELSKEDEWREAVELFSPRLSELLMTFGNPEKLSGRLEAIGLMRRDVDNREYLHFFSASRAMASTQTGCAVSIR